MFFFFNVLGENYLYIYRLKLFYIYLYELHVRYAIINNDKKTAKF